MSARTLIIAEAGVNHNGDVNIACELVRQAVAIGADAVKFQSFKADQVASAGAEKAAYQKSSGDTAENQLQLLSALELDEAGHRRVLAECQRLKIQFLSTPFDHSSADMLHKLGVSMFKIASGDITNSPFLRHLARFGKPLILSTGMSTLTEVQEALRVLTETQPVPVSLLHCVSQYPAPAEQMNLRCMETMRRSFGLPVGLSDHSLGCDIALAAVALGATIIEKHFTLDRTMHGPDHAASLEVAEFGEMIKAIRRIETALGNGIKEPAPCELENRILVRRSLVAGRALKAGHQLAGNDIAIKRPAKGIPPGDLEKVIGRELKKDLDPDEPITWSIL